MKRPNHKSAAALSFSLLLAATTTLSMGCDKAQEGSPGAEISATAPDNAEELTAMAHYAESFNAMTGKPQQCFDEYFKHIPETGPEPGKHYRLFPRHTLAAPGLQLASARIDEASKISAEKVGHLQPLAKAALSDLEQVIPLFADIHKYFDSESYKDDDGRKGKELHQKMVQLAQSYRGHIEQLETALSEVERQQTQAELKLHEKDKSYSYWFRAFNFEANQLLRASAKERYATAFDKLNQAHQGLKSFAEAKQSGLNAAFKAYVAQADRFHSTAVKRSRAMAETAHDEDAVANLHGDLIDNYNNMVGVTNTLYELEGQALLK